MRQVREPSYSLNRSGKKLRWNSTVLLVPIPTLKGLLDFPEARTAILTPRLTKVKRLFFHQASFRVNRNVLACQCQLFDVAEEHHVGDYVMAYVSRLYRVAWSVRLDVDASMIGCSTRSWGFLPGDCPSRCGPMKLFQTLFLSMAFLRRLLSCWHRVGSLASDVHISSSGLTSAFRLACFDDVGAYRFRLFDLAENVLIATFNVP